MTQTGAAMKSQSGYIAVLFAALLALGLTLTVGTLVAQLKRSGMLNRSMVAGGDNAQQAELAADQQKLLAWYRNNAYAVDSLTGQPNLNSILTQSGVQLHGASADVSDLVMNNGVGYHVFVVWFPAMGATGTGLNHTQGDFFVGAVGGQSANTPYVLVSGQALETQLVQQTRINMYRIADLLTSYFDDQQAADADMAVDTNWFRASSCPTDGTAALPCFGYANDPASQPDGSAVPVTTAAGLQTLQPMIGLSPTDMVTAWNTASSCTSTDINCITINNFPSTPAGSPPSSGPPFSVTLSTMLPWGVPMTVYAVSN